MAAISCIEDLQNVGRSECKVLPRAFRTFIKTPLDWSISADATPTEWQQALEAVKSNRVYLFPPDYDFENVSEETVYATSGLGQEVFVRQGQYRFRLTFLQNLELHKAMYSHLNSGGRILPIDLDSKLIYTSQDDGDTIQGFTLDNFNPENMIFGGGSDPSLSPIRFSWANGDEFNRFGFQLLFSSTYLALKPLTTVKLTIVGTPSDTEIQVKVASILDGTVVLGLATADFVVSQGTVTGVTDANSDGTYIIAGSSGFAPSGTVNLVAASALTVRGFESAGAVPYAVTS